MNETDLTIETLIEGDGYTLLESVIDSDSAAGIRERMLARLDEGHSASDGVVRMGNILDWGSEFEALATHPSLLAIAHALLGDDAALGAFSGRVLMPGCEPGALHVDYPYWAMNTGMPVQPALMLQVIWMMEPFTADNGGTWVAPGSQHWAGTPNTERFEEHALQATGQAGDAIISHGLLWHRTARNHTSNPRVAVLINYIQLTVRPMVPWGPFTDEFNDAASPALRTLLALDYGEALKRRLPTANGK